MALDRVKTKAKAEQLLRSGKIQDAVREYQKLVEDSPHDISSLNQLGNLQLRLGNKEAAVPLFFKVAELYNKQGFAVKAMASLKIVTREHPDNIQAHKLLATLCEQQGFIKEARLALEKVSELTAKTGDVEEAVRVDQKLLELEPENFKIRVHLGDLFMKLGKKAEGVQSYLKAGQSLVQQGLLKEAALIFARTLEHDPRVLGSIDGVVRTLLAQKDSPKALQFVETLQDQVKEPDARELLGLLKGDVLVEERSFQEAYNIFAEVLAKKPASPAALPRMVRLLLGQKAIGEAAAFLEKASLSSEDQAILGPVEALYEEVMRFAPNHLSILRGMARHYRLGRKMQNLRSILDKLAETAKAAGDLASSRAALQELLTLEPENPGWKSRLGEVEQRLAPKPAPAPAPPPKPEPPAAPPPPAPKPAARPEPAPAPPKLPAKPVPVAAAGPSPQPPKPPAKPAPAPGPLPVSKVPPKADSPPLPREPRSEELSIDVDIEVENTGEAEIEVNFDDVNMVSTEVTAAHPLPKAPPPSLPAIDLAKPEARPQAVAGPPDAQQAEVIREQLTEAEVFLKYGLVEKAVAELQNVLKKIPDHIQAHQKLIAIFKEQKKKDKAVRQILKLAAIFRDHGDPDMCESLMEEAREVDPNHKAIQEFFEGTSPEAATPAPAAPEEIPMPLLEAVKPPKVTPAKPSAPLPAILIEAPQAPPTPKAQHKSHLAELDLDLLTAAAPPARAVPEPAPAEDVDFAIELEERSKGPAEEIIPAKEEITFAAIEQEAAESPEVTEKLEEAEFYLSQELFGEAQKAIVALEQLAPDDEKVKDLRARLDSVVPPKPPPQEEDILILPEEEPPHEEKVAAVVEEPGQSLEETGPEAMVAEEEAPKLPEIPALGLPPLAPEEIARKTKTKMKVTLQDLLEEEAAPAEEAATEAPEEEYYDLAAELGAALDGLQSDGGDSLFEEEEAKSPEEMSFEEVFEEFKKGVQSKVGEEDAATHYNLGIAYKEMELVDEAIAEFQVAARSPDFFVECCAMLGICFRIKGLGELAEKWYRKGIEAPGFSEDAYIGLKYDLAETLEEQGRAGDAQVLYKEVYAANASYRDIKKRFKK